MSGKRTGVRSFIILILLLGVCSFVWMQYSGEKQITEKDGPIVVSDSLGRIIHLKQPVTRVAIANAYNTDLTEMVSALDCLDAIVGIDQNILWNNEAFHNRFTRDQLICAREGTVINYERVVELAPQVLLISSKGSWFDAQEKLKPFGIQVIVIDTHDLSQFSANCRLLGEIFGKERRAEELEHDFGSLLAYVGQQLAQVKEKKRVYFECGSPGATTMPGSYFYSLVKYTGADNIMNDAVERHITPEAVVLRNPQYIVKMSDRRWKYSYQPPTKKEVLMIRQDIKTRPGWDSIDAVKNDHIFQLSYFSHCGASKIIGVLYVAKYLYPEYLPDLNPDEAFRLWLEKYLKLPYIAGHVYDGTAAE